MSQTLLYDLLRATGETAYMVALSTVFSILISLPMGTLLFTSASIKKQPFIHRCIAGFINLSRLVQAIINQKMKTLKRSVRK